MGTLAYLSLGSNLGDRKAQLESALTALVEAPGLIVRASSSFHETPPVGGPGGQGAFLNAAAAIETSLDPTDLLTILQTIELRAGRTRTVRWGERPLDLDLLLYGELRLHTCRTPAGGREGLKLIVPHPRMVVRRFVLAPLAEVAPEAIEPCTGHMVADLLANLDRRPSIVALDHRCPSRDSLFSKLVPRLSAVGLYYGDGPASDGPDRESWYDRRRRELHAENWPAATWGDRPLLTDVWFEESSEEARRRMVSPTFVVDSRDLGLTPPATSIHPTLRIEEDDVEAMAEEIASAFEASRAGRASC